MSLNICDERTSLAVVSLKKIPYENRKISAIYIISICIPIEDKALSARAAFGSKTRPRSVTFLYPNISYGTPHCHIKYYLCSLAHHKRDQLTRACRERMITVPHIKHEGRPNRKTISIHCSNRPINIVNIALNYRPRSS